MITKHKKQVISVISELVKHLPGQHDQASHAGVSKVSGRARKVPMTPEKVKEEPSDWLDPEEQQFKLTPKEISANTKEWPSKKAAKIFKDTMARAASEGFKFGAVIYGGYGDNWAVSRDEKAWFQIPELDSIAEEEENDYGGGW